MKVAILTTGSRGDVQPYVALGAGLKAAGHEVVLATGKGFAGFVAGHGLRHAALDVDLFERMQTPEGKAALAGKNLPGTIRKVMATYRRLLDDEWTAAQGADVVVYHPKALGGYHVAEALGVPGFLAHPIPMFSPTRAFPNPVLPFADLGRLPQRGELRGVPAPAHRTVPSYDQPLAQGVARAPPTPPHGERVGDRGRAGTQPRLLQPARRPAPRRLERLHDRDGVLVPGAAG